jgi:lipoprotein-anchoring transpeptidase ErfK/SrfK
MTEGSFTPCFLVLAHGTIPSLGKVADRRVAVLLHSTTKCMQVRLSVVLTVGARGTIDADAATKRCVDPQAHVKAVPFTITGGTRAFAGATGSGTITIRTGTEGPVETETWKGSLTLPR